jgi:hypothetical protein
MVQILCAESTKQNKVSQPVKSLRQHTSWLLTAGWSYLSSPSKTTVVITRIAATIGSTIARTATVLQHFFKPEICDHFVSKR